MLERAAAGQRAVSFISGRRALQWPVRPADARSVSGSVNRQPLLATVWRASPNWRPDLRLSHLRPSTTSTTSHSQCQSAVLHLHRLCTMNAVVTERNALIIL